MGRRFCLMGLCLGMVAVPLAAQSLVVQRVSAPLVIDGLLNESAWRKADSLGQFVQFNPAYGQPASLETTVKILMDDQTLYAAFVCHDPEPQLLSAMETKRDGNVENEDAIGLMLDTFGDGSNGYLFLVNVLGTQKDGRLADNGRTEDFQWDESWSSTCRVHETGWVAELAIPLKSIKFNKHADHWGFNAARRIGRLRETCVMVHDMTDPYRVSQFARLEGLALQDLSLKKWTLMPYGQSQFQEGASPVYEAGLGVRYNPASQIGFEATVNPDFATIEADVEQVNLTRFERSYAEKRPFFLEGNENYTTRIQQFYSRRIGEIPWGVKTSGKLGAWKVNGLVTQSDPATAGQAVAEGTKALYTVFRFNRDLPKGSSIGVIGANRRYDGLSSGSVGLTTTLFFTDVWGVTGQIIRSHGAADKGVWTGFIRPAYDSEDMHFHVRYSHYGTGVRENINPIGFITHDDRREVDANVTHTFWVNRGGLESMAVELNENRYWSQTGTLRSWTHEAQVEVAFLKQFELDLGYESDFKAQWAPYFEKDFRNHEWGADLVWENHRGLSLNLEVKRGVSYDADMEEVAGGVDVQILKGWNAEYRFKRTWLSPAEEDEDNAWIHYLRTSYYLNKDLYFKLFYQTRYQLDRFWRDAYFDLLRKTLQVVFVWRFLPPFGALQLAYQEGRTLHTETDEKGRSLFAKLSWVF